MVFRYKDYGIKLKVKADGPFLYEQNLRDAMNAIRREYDKVRKGKK